ncbi:MAG: hypothetical protein JST45_13365 [Bacteroidetes bacterium]|nr:hypothetical protein [Bacteroidota bacterium]
MHRNEKWTWGGTRAELEGALLRNFMHTERPVPQHPHWSRTTTVVIRKQVLPYYYAIYDHELHRYVELQYRVGRDAPLCHMDVPAEAQPPTIGAQ